MKPDNHPSILRLKLGGGTRHRIVCAAYGALALERGWRVDDLTQYRPQEGQQLPDLVISKTEKIHHKRKDYRYRVEVIDTHDPIPDGNPGFGFNGVIKVYVAAWEGYCASDHEKISAPGFAFPHSLCYEGLLWLLERSLP